MTYHCEFCERDFDDSDKMHGQKSGICLNCWAWEEGYFTDTTDIEIYSRSGFNTQNV